MVYLTICVGLFGMRLYGEHAGFGMLVIFGVAWEKIRMIWTTLERFDVLTDGAVAGGVAGGVADMVTSNRPKDGRTQANDHAKGEAGRSVSNGELQGDGGKKDAGALSPTHLVAPKKEDDAAPEQRKPQEQKALLASFSLRSDQYEAMGA